MKHTPGPWQADEMACYVWGKDENGGPFTVAEIRGWAHLSSHHTDDEAIAIQTANARLIAAAPEMYEMLSKLREEMDNLSFNLQTERDIEYAEDTRDSIHALLRRIERDDAE